PEFDSSTKATRSSWAAHTYNVAGSDEIGHFEYFDVVNPDFTCGSSPTSAGWAGNSTPAHDAASDPEPIQFTTPTIRGTQGPFSKVAFEADTPSFEPECNVDTGVGCTGQPVGAQFYPIYTAGSLIGGGSFAKTGPPRPCVWQFAGPHYAGTTDNFGGTA